MRLWTALLCSALLGSSVLAQDHAAPVAPVTEPGQIQDEVSADYQSDLSRLMKIVVSSLYHDKDVFLRELISNSGDALEKLRFLSLTDGSLMDGASDLNVTIRGVKAENESEIPRLIFTDTGIGMTKEELSKNLGTIAKSGTSDFLAKLEQNEGAASNLIGQFGLGFYSSFLVANRVTVASKSPHSDTQYVFDSSAEAGSFRIYADPRGNTLGRGTEITLYLKPDATEYLQHEKLRMLVQKHSEFATGDAPIYIWTEEVTSEMVPEEPSDAETPASEDDELEQEADEAEGTTEPKMVKKAVEKKYFKMVNQQPPIWMRDAKDLAEEDYQKFFKATFKEDAAHDPLVWTHFKGDAGSTSFRGLMYVPKEIDPQFYSKSYIAARAIRLYVRRVYITSDLGTGFLPNWLSWLRVVVDADNLPLNVGRDSLQKTEGIKAIKATIQKKVIDMFAQTASKDPEKYEELYKATATALKIATAEDKKNQAKLVKLLRFSSSVSNFTSLEDYVSRRKQGQKQIFYIAGAAMTKEHLEKSPFVETALARGYEVLYLLDPVDEMLVGQVRKFNSMTFQDVGKKGLKYGDEAESAEDLEEEKTRYQPLLKFLTKKLSSSISDVIISTRLTTSPSAVVASEYAWTGNMERLMAAQGQREDLAGMQSYLKSQKKILEINPKHPLLEALLNRVEEDGDLADDDEELNETVTLLYETSLIKSGFNMDDVNSYFTRVEKLLRKGLGVSESAKANVDVKSAPPVETGPLPEDTPDEPMINMGGAPGGDWQDWSKMKEELAKEEAKTETEAESAPEPEPASSAAHDEL